MKTVIRRQLVCILIGIVIYIFYLCGFQDGARGQEKAKEIAGPNIYVCEVTRVYDGDTFYCNIHLGLDVILKDQKIRLANRSEPEIRTKDPEEKAAGFKAKAKLEKAIGGKTIHVYIGPPRRKGKYGRWLGIIQMKGWKK